MQLWTECLDDLDVVILAMVVRDWILSRREAPTVADIRKAVAEKQLGNLAGAKLFMPPDEAWGYVQCCFGTVGQYREFPAEHPLIKRAVDHLGWREMCQSDNLEVTRAQFRYAYSAQLERSLAESAASPGAAETPTALFRAGSGGERAHEGASRLSVRPDGDQVTPDFANIGEVRRLEARR